MSRIFSGASWSNYSKCERLEERRDEEIKALFDALDVENHGYLTIETIQNTVKAAGIDIHSSLMEKNFGDLMDGKDKIFHSDFSRYISNQKSLLQKILCLNLAIPDFVQFCKDLIEIFEEVRPDNQGKNASYIPGLAGVDSEKFGFAICSACENLGIDEVHRYVGREPSGKEFNAFTLSRDNRPHNPMINAGAIITHGFVCPNQRMSVRSKFVINLFSRFSGNSKIGFCQPTYLSEKETANKNFSLAYFMKSKGAFPKDKDIRNELDFYFQICSLQVTCRSMAIMAATLATGGRCPITNETLISRDIAKNCLQILLSCGMYDYSGEWACTIGLPAKSGVSGSILVVIPNVMGLAIWSPRLDSRGNSYRGIQFCTKMTEKFSLSLFDQMLGGRTQTGMT